MFITRIRFKRDNTIRDKITKICLDIAAKDPTFRYTFSIHTDGRFQLEIKSQDRDTAHKRGLLFTKKYLAEFDLGYEVYSEQQQQEEEEEKEWDKDQEEDIDENRKPAESVA